MLFRSLTGRFPFFCSLITVIDGGWKGVTVQGKTVSVATGASAASAIDTGTTLIGGPSTDVAAIYAAIPGSQAVQGNGGFYAFRTSLFPTFNFCRILMAMLACSTNVSITLAFGGKPWSINPVDMNLGPVNSGSSYCVGAIYGFTPVVGEMVLTNVPHWVIGDTFLKNVYTVFRTNPLSIGFATLSVLAGGSGVEQGEPLSLGVDVC